jgi:hypothetical protein
MRMWEPVVIRPLPRSVVLTGDGRNEKVERGFQIVNEFSIPVRLLERVDRERRPRPARKDRLVP